MPPSHEDREPSVTLWIADLKRGDGAAADALWKRYFDKLVQVARRKLGGASRRIADEDDVAQNVFDTLFRGAAAGNFTQLHDREDLWRLLVAITQQKAVDQVRRQVSQKRGGADLRGESIFAGQTDGQGFEQFLAAEPTPEFVALMDEEQARLMSLLTDDTQRQIARLRMEGYANEEIAQRLQVALRTVERKLGLIRQAWQQEIPPGDPTVP